MSGATAAAEPGRTKYWVAATLEPTLLMAVLLVSLGTVVSWQQGPVEVGRYVLAMIGTVLAQLAVNVLNDYFDFKSGVDLKTQKTPFSGGSRFLAEGLLPPEALYRVGALSLGIAGVIGLYFVLTRGWLLLPLLLFAGAAVYFYTPVFARLNLGEFMAGFNLGPLAVLGAAFVQTGTYSLTAFLAAVPPGLMIANVLLLNEVPDMEADRDGGRRNLVTTLGRSGAVQVYSALEIIAYLWIVVAVALELLPTWTLLGLLSLPLALGAIRKAHVPFTGAEAMIPALGLNIAAAYATTFLLILGFALNRVL